MRNILKHQQRKCIFMLLDEFEDVIEKAIPDGTLVTYCEQELFFETDGQSSVDRNKVLEALSDYFGVNVTSIHTDGYDEVGVWIVYKEADNAGASQVPCRSCYNARFDDELTDENDFASKTIGTADNDYRMMYSSGYGKPPRLQFDAWNDKRKEWMTVGLYYPKHCPECGREINEYTKGQSKVNKYKVNVTRKGSLFISAGSMADALEKSEKLTEGEIEQQAVFEDYLVVRVDEVEKPQYYYEIYHHDNKKTFFRSTKEMRIPKDINAYAKATGIIPPEVCCTCSLILPEIDYRHDLYQYLRAVMNSERSAYFDSFIGQKSQKILDEATKINFYNEMIWNFIHNSESFDYKLSSLEVLAQKIRPLHYLYENHFEDMDFEDANNEHRKLFNAAVFED